MKTKFASSLGSKPCFFCLFVICTFLTPTISETKGPSKQDGPVQNGTSSNDQLIDLVCKKAPYYKLCVDTLKADPRHTTADEAGLVTIAIKSTITHAMHTLLYAGRLARSTQNEPRYTKAYNVCRERYSDVVGKFADWLNRVDKDSNHLAVRWVQSGIDDIVTCHKSFNAKGMVNTLSSSNIHLLRMCSNVLEILKH